VKPLGSGYGVVGLTRAHRVRRRLRAIKNCLAITLGRLAKVRWTAGPGWVMCFFGFFGEISFWILMDAIISIIFIGFSMVFHSMILCRIDSWMFMG